MADIAVSFFLVRLQCVGIICEGRNLYALFLTKLLDFCRLLLVQIGNINMAYTRISSLCAALWPAGYLQTFQLIFCGKIHNFLKCHALADRC